MLIVTETNFEEEVLKSELPVLVDFYTEWCGPCKILAPVLEELAGELEGKIKIGKINVEEHTAPAQNHSVMAVPTLIVFKGGEAVKRMEGAMPKEALLNEVKEFAL